LKKKRSGSKHKKKKPDAVQPPRPDEYLPATIQKAVINTGIKHPLTIYPVAFGISCGAVGWLFQISNLYLAALGLALLGPIWAIGQIFLRNESLGSSYLKELNRKQRNYEKYLKTHLASEFKECKQTKGLEDSALQGMEQLESIQTKHANVQELLEMKLNTGEITFGRFLGAAEQVTLSVLDNLKRAAGILKSAASIQPDYIKERLQAIDQKKDRSPEDEDQAEALENRLALWDEQLAKVNRLIASNEEAMTEMEKISAAIAEWRTDDSFASTDFESALTRLQALASSAHEYNKV